MIPFVRKRLYERAAKMMSNDSLESLSNKIKTMEHTNISQFSTYKETDTAMIYQDTTIKDMYTHNLMFYKDIRTHTKDITEAVNQNQSSFYRQTIQRY